MISSILAVLFLVFLFVMTIVFAHRQSDDCEHQIAIARLQKEVNKQLRSHK